MSFFLGLVVSVIFLFYAGFSISGRNKFLIVSPPRKAKIIYSSVNVLSIIPVNQKVEGKPGEKAMNA